MNHTRPLNADSVEARKYYQIYHHFSFIVPHCYVLEIKYCICGFYKTTKLLLHDEFFNHTFHGMGCWGRVQNT